MKKVWNAPDMQELTVRSTAWWGGGNGHGDHSGRGENNLCRCEGGTSPCSRHHGPNWDDDNAEDELS